MAFKISGDLALLRLTRDCKFEEWRARRVLNIAWEFGIKCEPCPGGYVEVRYHGLSEFRDPEVHLFTIIEHIGESPRRKVAAGELSDYTQEETEMPSRYNSGKARIKSRSKGMAPKTRRQTAPEPETAEANGEAVDYQKYLDKDLTATMADYVEWFEANVSALEDVPVDKLLSLGSTLYPHFQRSEFNQERRAERQAAREAEAEPEKPARTGRAAKPATAKPATRSTAKPASRAPARAGSGRRGSTRSSAAAPEAPF